MSAKKIKIKYKHKFYGNKKGILNLKNFYKILFGLTIILSISLIVIIYIFSLDFVKQVEFVPEKKEMTYIFNDNQGLAYNLNKEIDQHGAADKRDYLFNDNQTTTNNISTGIKEDIKKIPIDNKNLNLIEKNNCTTPRGKILKDSESVLAYQQRNDVPDICNIQRRVCHDGILGGSYEQKSCQTDVQYDYTTQKIETYNEKKIDPFIQSDKAVVVNSGGNFDPDGKLNSKEIANSVWNNNINDVLKKESTGVEQNIIIKPNCISPWGDIIYDRQFIKAYRLKNGFSNHPCEIQIRTCMDGKLEGDYLQQSCKTRETSYENFIDGYYSSGQASIQNIIETLNSNLPVSAVKIDKKNTSIFTLIADLFN